MITVNSKIIVFMLSVFPVSEPCYLPAAVERSSWSRARGPGFLAQLHWCTGAQGTGVCDWLTYRSGKLYLGTMYVKPKKVLYCAHV